ncbi:thiosulfate/3-mercaptopyruvate sulfurtransferase [Actinoplanes tereljensis]|uniref:Sulfurtransferase n=1 Tax=Paractinoplanes tereljensis TaxID=571912 RepID=A0A919TQT0_9ACTN|nr:sulfurtransferase [Actinoplanes tereljensis]GIF19488.1 sulfurtransferase [Actinoplanes tereljensis]
MVIEPVVGLDRVDERWVLADVRYYLDGRSGRAAYQGGHLPGAIFVDMDQDLAAHAGPADGRHPLPEAAAFAARMAELGIGDDDTVIAYDDAGGVMAARLVWMLRATGHDAALLDGGLGAYPGELETAVPQRPRATFTHRPWPADRLAGIDEAASGSFVVIDARQPERFRGESEPIDPRPGHIPGARSVPCRENVDADGRFLAPQVLRERFAKAGVTADSEVISYCGSGVTACHNLLALERAGFAPARLYPGSWSQYSATDRPAATGD